MVKAKILNEKQEEKNVLKHLTSESTNRTAIKVEVDKHDAEADLAAKVSPTKSSRTRARKSKPSLLDPNKKRRSAPTLDIKDLVQNVN